MKFTIELSDKVSKMLLDIALTSDSLDLFIHKAILEHFKTMYPERLKKKEA